MYDIEFMWETATKKGGKGYHKLDKASVNAQIDMALRKLGYTPIWKMQGYIDTDTGEERTGLILDAVAEVHSEAKKSFTGKDEYGMKRMGYITLVNGTEPGKGTISLDTSKAKKGDKVEVLIKEDEAIYSPLEKAA